MNSRQLLYSIYVVLFLSILCCCQHKMGKPAQLSFKASLIELDTVFKSDPVRTFEVECRNIGEEPLIIDTVETTCHCTTVDYPKEPLKGGRSFSLQITFDASGYSPSEVINEVKIFSNSLDAPHTIAYKAQVAYPVEPFDTCASYILY